MCRSNKNTRDVKVTQSVMVALERIRQTIEVATGAPAMFSCVDVEPGPIRTRKDSEGYEWKNRHLGVSGHLSLLFEYGSVSGERRIGWLSGMSFNTSLGLVLHPISKKWDVEIDRTFDLSISCQRNTWARLLHFRWSGAPIDNLVRVQEEVYDPTGSMCPRIRFPSDRGEEDTLGRKHMPAPRSRTGYSHAYSWDEDCYVTGKK